MGPKGWRKFSTILLLIALREAHFQNDFLSLGDSMRRDGDRFPSKFRSGELSKIVRCAMRDWISSREALRPRDRTYCINRLAAQLEAFEVGLGGFEIGKETLFGLELAGVDAAAAGFDADGMLEVEHLVVEQILDGATRGVGAIEDAADDDGVVGGVVVAEHAAGVVGAPGERGPAEEAVEEAGVE